MTAANDIRARVLAIITAVDGNHQANEPITGDMRLIADLGWDSLDIVEATIEAEHQFGIALDDFAADSTVDGVVGLVMRTIAMQGVA